MNWVAVLVAAVASYILGALWYGPLFGKKWMKLVGMTKKDMDKNKDKMPLLYFGGFVVALVTAAVLSILLGMTTFTGMTGGMHLAFYVWLGFFATSTMGGVLWEGRPFALWLLNNEYNLINLLLMGAILGAL